MSTGFRLTSRSTPFGMNGFSARILFGFSLACTLPSFAGDGDSETCGGAIRAGCAHGHDALQ